MRAALRTYFSELQFQYEILIAPFIARWLWWIYWPVYFFCKIFRVCFVVNIASSTGHAITELDYFFRLLSLKQIDPSKRYVWVKKRDPYAEGCIRLYGGKFSFTCASFVMYDLCLPLTMAFHDLTVDAGISRLKWQLPKSRAYREFIRGHTYLHLVSKKEGIETTVRYFKNIEQTAGFSPVTEADFSRHDLGKLFTKGLNKLALVHAKDVVRNSTAEPIDPATYCATLSYLTDLGYQLAFVGREKMPETFSRYNMINYAQSSIASYYHDLCLFFLADVLLLSACGILSLADCLNKYHLCVNSWHTSVPPFSRRSVFVPALVQTLQGKCLSFQEQNQLYKSLDQEGFPLGKYKARNATEVEILEGMRELLQLKEKQRPRTALQERYRQLDQEAPLKFAGSRCSHFFLEQHATLLD